MLSGPTVLVGTPDSYSLGWVVGTGRGKRRAWAVVIWRAQGQVGLIPQELASSGAYEASGDGEDAQPQAFRFITGGGTGQGEALGPGEQVCDQGVIANQVRFWAGRGRAGCASRCLWHLADELTARSPGMSHPRPQRQAGQSAAPAAQPERTTLSRDQRRPH